ncbi:MAG: helix-turn-helix domain-containing protein [Candidatus Longimicrobiales bacterium M2_2A_002]
MDSLTLRDRLRKLVEALPPGSSATLPRDQLAEWIEAEEPEPLADLTVEDVAGIMDRAPSTVRGWCHDGKLRAYRLNGNEWRIPHEALREYQRGQLEDQKPDDPESDDLSSWRDVA